eukprot:3432594-Pleurochrysis_carterae.AAC.1
MSYCTAGSSTKLKKRWAMRAFMLDANSFVACDVSVGVGVRLGVGVGVTLSVGVGVGAWAWAWA